MERAEEHYLKRELDHWNQSEGTFLEFLLQTALDGVWFWDLERPENEWMSPEFWRLLGYDPTTKPHLATAWQDIIHPDDLQLALANFERHCADSSHPYDQVVRYRHQSGSTIWVRCRGVALRDANGKAVRMLGVHTDVTQLNESKEALRLELQKSQQGRDRLQLVLSTAGSLCWDRNLVSQAVWYSQNVGAYFGLDSEPGEDQEQALLAVVHPEDREALRRAQDHAAATGGCFALEFRGPDRDLHTRWYSLNGRAFQDAAVSTRMVGVVLDVTEHRRRGLEREKLERRIQEGQKLESLGVLAGGIAHDFNNLLMVIMGNASLLGQQLAVHSSHLAHVHQIEEAASRGAELCKQMLAYAGKGRFVLTRTNLNQLIEGTIHLLKVSIGKSVVLRYQLYSELPAIVVDATQIRQVLMNLVINASDAIGERSGVVSISTGVVRADRAYLDKTLMAPEIREGDYVFMEVSDTGRGMKPEDQTRIFEPFFSTKSAGRGLGLAAVIGIVRGHKGALKLYSELGKGSSFKLLLPLTAEEPESPHPTAILAQPLPRDQLLLVVDDEETQRAVISQMAESMGIRAISASDGREAVMLYNERHREISGVLLDLTMPHMNGEAAFHELRRINPHVRVLLMSGYNEQDAIAHFVGKGLAGFIQKPFGVPELREKLHAILKPATGSAVDD